MKGPLLTVGLLLVAAAAQPEPSQFEIAAKKKEDRIRVTVTDHKATVDIHSRSGIGSATITTKAGKWPQTVIVHFHLGGLERFAISAGKNTLSGFVTSYAENAKELHLRQGDIEVFVAETSDYWTGIKRMGADGKPTTDYPLKNGYFEIVVPEVLLRDHPKTLTISWIDFYRR